MDHPVTFAKEFAKLVRHIDERIDIPAQKAALRQCLAVLKSGPAALSAYGDLLFADRFIVPPDADATALALKISSQPVGAIAFETGAAPSDVLATARWLVAPAESTPLIAGMKTVRIDPPGSGDGTAPRGADFATSPATASEHAPRRRSSANKAIGATPGPRRKTGSSGTFPAFGSGSRAGIAAAAASTSLPRTRAIDLLELLDRAGGMPEVTRIVDELVITAEQAVHDEDVDLLADAMVGLLMRQSDPRGGALIDCCASALRRLTTPNTLRLIVLASTRTRSRTEGIQAVLAHAGEAGAVALIAQVGIARTLADRRHCFEVLLKIALAVPVLTKMLASPAWHVARNAADLLGQLHATEAEPALAGALQHVDERVRRTAAHALARLGTASAADYLHGALNDASPLVRIQAAGGIAARKDASSAATLTRALEGESDIEAQMAMIAALGKLATPDAVSRLISAAEPEGRLFKRRPVAFRVAAVHALGDVRTAAVRTALQALARDKERQVREAVLRVAMHSPRGEALDHG